MARPHLARSGCRLAVAAVALELVQELVLMGGQAGVCWGRTLVGLVLEVPPPWLLGSAA